MLKFSKRFKLTHKLINLNFTFLKIRVLVILAIRGFHCRYPLVFTKEILDGKKIGRDTPLIFSKGESAVIPSDLEVVLVISNFDKNELFGKADF